MKWIDVIVFVIDCHKFNPSEAGIEFNDLDR